MSDPAARSDPPPDDDLPAVFGFADGAWEERLRQAESVPYADPVGPYVELVEIGRGGQGVVFRARHAATGRKVALKRLAAGSFASAAARQRFQRELETVAGLEHPHIVRWIGVEVVDGQSVLVMEWIDGIPITEWSARGGRRPAREQVAMMVRICEAVQYAHRHGVIHRDLKPSNLLVDDEGEPRVLDFGLARPIREAVRVTGSSEFVGTPAYASPEQLRLGAGPVDVSADVFSLGVVLYEMLTGELPYDPDDATRFERIAAARPSRVTRDIARDLDLVVAKALHPDARQRYATVDAFAEDLARFIRGEAVLAHPPSTFYSLRKFVARNRLVTSLTGCVVLLLLLLALLSLRQARRLARERDTALTARALADQERSATESVLAFLADGILADAHPRRRGRSVTVVEAMSEARHRVPREFAQDPRLRGRIEAMLGRSHLEIGRFADAAELLAAALPRTDDRRERGRLLADLARAEIELSALGQGEAHLREAEAMLDAAGMIEERARARADLVRLLVMLCRFDEAEQLANGLTLGGPPAARVRGLLAAAEVARSRLRLAESETRLREAIALAADDPLLEGAAHHALSEVLEQRGALEPSAAAARRAYELRLAALSAEHKDTVSSRCRLGWIEYSLGHIDQARLLLTNDAGSGAVSAMEHALLLRACGRTDEARATLAAELVVVDDLYPQPHLARINVRMALAEILMRQCDLAAAEPMIRAALAIARELRAPAAHPDIAFCLNGLGLALKSQSRFVEAAACYHEALAILRRFFPDGHPNAVVILNNLGAMSYAQGEAAATHHFAEALAIARQHLAADHPDAIEALVGYATCLCVTDDQPAAAAPLLALAIERIRTTLPAEPRPDDLVRLAQAERRHGYCLITLGRIDEGLAGMHSAVTRLTEVLGASHIETLRTAAAYAQALERAGHIDAAEAGLIDAWQAARASLGALHGLTLQLCAARIALYLDHDQPERAAALARETATVADLPAESVLVFRGWHGLALLALDHRDDARAELAAAVDALRATGREGEVGARFVAALASLDTPTDD